MKALKEFIKGTLTIGGRVFFLDEETKKKYDSYVSSKCYHVEIFFEEYRYTNFFGEQFVIEESKSTMVLGATLYDGLIAVTYLDKSVEYFVLGKETHSFLHNKFAGDVFEKGKIPPEDIRKRIADEEEMALNKLKNGGVLFGWTRHEKDGGGSISIGCFVG